MITKQHDQPAYDKKGKLVLPNLKELGISKKMLEDMAAMPVSMDAHFCLTGIFALGEREAVAEQIEKHGGIVIRKVRRTGCIVVMGTAASDGWAGGAWGRKLEDAAACIKEGRPVTIITEDRLVEVLLQATPIELETPAAKRARYAGLVDKGELTAEEADYLRKQFASLP